MAAGGWGRIEVEGLSKFRRQLRQGDKEVQREMTVAFREIAKTVADRASQLAPHRTGALAAGYRGTAAGAKATVRNRVFYARFVETGFHPGGGDTYVEGIEATQRAIEELEPRIVEDVATAIDKAAERMGWT